MRFEHDIISNSIHLVLEDTFRYTLEPRGIVEEVKKTVIEALAKEFIDKYKEGILGALHPDQIAFELTPKIVEFLEAKLKEKV